MNEEQLNEKRTINDIKKIGKNSVDKATLNRWLGANDPRKATILTCFLRCAKRGKSEHVLL